jgi:hypothetical protein
MPNVKKAEKLAMGHKVILGIIVILILVFWSHGMLSGPRGGFKIFGRIMNPEHQAHKANQAYGQFGA